VGASRGSGGPPLAGSYHRRLDLAAASLGWNQAPAAGQVSQRMLRGMGTTASTGLSIAFPLFSAGPACLLACSAARPEQKRAGRGALLPIRALARDGASPWIERSEVGRLAPRARS